MRHADIELFKKAVAAFNEDYASSMGAALAYYTAFSLAPVLVVAIAVAGLVFGQDAARGEIVYQLRGLIGDQSAKAIQELLKSASQPGRASLASVVGVGTLLIGATSVFAELQSSLDRIWRAPALKIQSGMWACSASAAADIRHGRRNRLPAARLTDAQRGSVGRGPLGRLVVSHLAFRARSGEHWPGFRSDGMLFAMAYRILPRVKIAWRDVVIGAVVTAALFEGGKYPHRAVSRPRERELGLRRGRVVHHRSGVGVLLRANFPARRRVHLGVCAQPRLTRRPGARARPGDSDLAGAAEIRRIKRPSRRDGSRSPLDPRPIQRARS